jgi:L-ascorbate metabolism protein UlaG (beta-lactamase superfamily)
MTGIDGAVTWLGHATALLEMNGLRLVTDPLFRQRLGPLVRDASARPETADPVDGRVDAVLLSHLHADHADLASLRRIASGAPVVAPYGAGAWLRRSGLGGVQELRPGEQITLGEVSIEATAAVHEDRRRPLGGPRAQPVGYLITGSAGVYFAGDTDLFDAMADLRSRVNMALLPVWGWGRTLGPGHLDPDRAARAAALIAPDRAIPIHWGTYRLAWYRPTAAERERPAREFVELTRRYAPNVQAQILRPGERTEL